MLPDMEFYRGRKVLVTGHTGFKGAWLCRMLVNAGAAVAGYALDPPTDPALYDLAGLDGRMESVIGDIRDLKRLKETFEQTQPEIVFHLAAQPIVRESYRDPRLTYETNVMGTVNLLECVRSTPSVKSVLNVTTDKVYLNDEKGRAFREEDPLDGFDPYSNSKSCSELVTHSYIRSFFAAEDSPAVSTVRAGNVIGGGDFAADRLIPDCVRAVRDRKVIGVRNPDSIRPFQHVLEPLAVYLLIAQKQHGNKRYAGFYNAGPDDRDCLPAGELAELFCRCWGDGAAWEARAEENAPHEAGTLRLDCGKLKRVFGWEPRWHMEECIEKVCRFSRVWLDGGDIPAEMDREIGEFLA
ncbi:MAG: CDP-glucose 4,6-dehydratase [Clostridia bacterium]|nr:CDP-glucose 4,6-dehydratase [Clostridia bacterium]